MSDLAGDKTRRALMTTAIGWISLNDAPGDNDDIPALESYLTVALVADLFGLTTRQVAQAIWTLRNP